MINLKQAWYIAAKDLKIFSRDRASVFFFVVFPFMFIVLFNFLMSGVGAEDERLQLHVATQEAEGGLSYQILAAMETTDVDALAPGDPVIVWERDYAAARQAVDDSELIGFVAFPADFTTAVYSGTVTDLEVYAQADAVNTRAALNGLASGIASQIGGHATVIEASMMLLGESGQLPADPAAIEQAVQEIMATLFTGGDGTDYVTFSTEKVGEMEAENPANWVIPGYLVMFVFFAGALGAESIVRERKNYTLERLLTTSVTPSTILAGIFTGHTIRGLVQIALFWGLGVTVFKVDMGLSPLAVVILSVEMVLMSAAFALMLATLAKTQRAAGSLGTITSLVLAPLGGCWWPNFLYPDWLQAIAKITPHAWATTGFNKLMVFGADFSGAVPEMWALLGFTVVFGVIAVLRFRTSAV